MTPGPTAQSRMLAALADASSLLSLDPGQLDTTLRLARRARLLGRLGALAERQGVAQQLPRVAVDQLESAVVAAHARARATAWELDRLAWALQDLPEVPLVALKGTAYLLAGTPNSPGRLFSDVDVMVPGRHLPEVERRLLERGWVGKELTPYDDQYYRRWAHELPPLVHAERDVEVDLHRGILMPTARLRPVPELLFERAREITGSRFAVLAPPDMVLHAMVHLFYGGEVSECLRELVDIDLLLRHFAGTEPGFWDDFWDRAVQLDLTRPAFYGLRYAQQIVGCPVPDAVARQAARAAPVASVVSLMDRLVSRVILPNVPGLERVASRDLARGLLYVRSHWIKMPPVMLARHLAVKAWAGLRQGSSETSRVS